MKKYNHPLSFGSLLLAACLVCSSCDKGFEEMNTNPDASPAVTPGYMFTKAQYDGASDLLILLMGTMQYTTSYNDVAGFGSKYVTSQNTQSYGLFTNAFPKESLALYDAIVAGDMKTALAIYRWFMPLLHLDAEHDLVQSIKLAEQIMGRGSERVRPPRYVLTGERRAEVTKIVEDAAAKRPRLK